MISRRSHAIYFHSFLPKNFKKTIATMKYNRLSIVHLDRVAYKFTEMMYRPGQLNFSALILQVIIQLKTPTSLKNSSTRQEVFQNEREAKQRNQTQQSKEKV